MRKKFNYHVFLGGQLYGLLATYIDCVKLYESFCRGVSDSFKGKLFEVVSYAGASKSILFKGVIK